MLYDVCNEIRKQEHWLWPRPFDEAGVKNVGPDYQQNLWRGKISKANAAAFYKWVYPSVSSVVEKCMQR
jgi:hypothetical protein